jgi:hypothetical protein
MGHAFTPTRGRVSLRYCVCTIAKSRPRFINFPISLDDGIEEVNTLFVSLSSGQKTKSPGQIILLNEDFKARVQYPYIRGGGI